ncbi:hypothetical protein AgCh_008938 [Apium graveolens]
MKSITAKLKEKHISRKPDIIGVDEENDENSSASTYKFKVWWVWNSVGMEGAMMVKRQLHDKMKIEVEQVLEHHRLQNSKPMQHVE